MTYLKAHRTEIVVVRTCSDGIKKAEVPSHDVITSFANKALVGSGLILGNSTSFQLPISTLRRTGQRLILVQENPKYDSYADGTYFTLDPAPIINRFNEMNTKDQAGNDYTVLQCQVSLSVARPVVCRC